jgi:type VI secretion system protein VasG
MSQLNLKSLVSKLDTTCRNSLESAAGLCLARTNYNVEIEHWLLKLLEAPDTDLAAICRHYGIDVSRFSRQLTAVVDRLKTGNARSPALSPQIITLLREAWLTCSIGFGASHVRSSHLLYALLAEDSLARLAGDGARELEKISTESLYKELAAITANTAEAAGEWSAEPSTSPAQPGEPAVPGARSKTPALDQFTMDLTARAHKGEIDPVLGRDREIRQIIDILMRRRQNNPILTGEAGVGKTAVVEGFALRVAASDVPPPLKNVSVRTLDLGLLQAGAGIKGEFENRLKSVIDEVKASPRPIIVFIDEAHTMIGAGGQAGQGDAANLLKPALARGELRTIAATTWAEYKKYFEKDAALARRFQVVKVEEPDESSGVNMMRGLVGTLEKHHKVRILDEAVSDAVHLSQRYISGRQLPDKAVSLLDTACARVAISHSAIPSAVEDCRRRIAQLGTEIEILTRESQVGSDHQARLTELAEAKTAAEAEVTALEARWKEESRLVRELRQIREQLIAGAGTDGAAPIAAASTSEPVAQGGAKATAPSAGSNGLPLAPAVEALTAEDRRQLQVRLQELVAQLQQLQGEQPLMQVCVDSQTIAEVVSGWTGIPVGRMMTDEIRTILTLKERMEQRVVGQSHALEAIAQRIRTSRANLTDPRRPIGVFLLVGPSGVGKTETAIVLAELLYGGDQNMTVINMSEFKEEHKVSLLMGSPPGYVGYGEGGVLTEAVRRRPYSVVLLDEMEKAHPGVQDIFYQVFDKGTLRDGEGRDIDFKNTVILMTSNAGTDLIMKLCADPTTCPAPSGLAEALHPELLKTFKPAFLGRVTLVPYFPLNDSVMRSIVELQLGRIRRRVQENHRAAFNYDPGLVAGIASRCTEVESGARNVDHILTRTLLPEMSAAFLARMANNEPIAAVHVSISAEGGFCYDFS